MTLYFSIISKLYVLSNEIICNIVIIITWFQQHKKNIVNVIISFEGRWCLYPEKWFPSNHFLYYIIQNGEHIALFRVCNLNQANINNRFYNTMISIRIIQIIHISLKFNQRFFIFSFVNWCLQNGSVGKGICYLHHQIPVFNIQPHNMGKNNKYSRCIDTSLLFICLYKRLNYM